MKIIIAQRILRKLKLTKNIKKRYCQLENDRFFMGANQNKHEK